MSVYSFMVFLRLFIWQLVSSGSSKVSVIGETYCPFNTFCLQLFFTSL